MSNLMKKIATLWPIFLIGIIAWILYTLWINQMPSKITLSNSVEAKDVKVSSKVTGRISTIYIKEGDKVKAGQKLLELEGDEIVAGLNQAIANLKKSESEYIDLKKGARPQEIAQAAAQTNKTEALLEEAKAKYENAQRDYERMEELYKEGAISKQKSDEFFTKKDVAEKEVASYEEELIKSKENENLVKEGPRKDQLSALRAQIEYYKEKVKELNKYTTELTVISPLDGEVSSFDLKVGEVIKANQPLLTITDLSDIYVRVYIGGNQLGKVKPKQKVKLIADSFPNEFFNGYISYIGAQAEFTPRNIQTPEERTKLVYPVKIQIENKENKLRDGMYITVQL